MSRFASGVARAAKTIDDDDDDDAWSARRGTARARGGARAQATDEGQTLGEQRGGRSHAPEWASGGCFFTTRLFARTGTQTSKAASSAASISATSMVTSEAGSGSGRGGAGSWLRFDVGVGVGVDFRRVRRGGFFCATASDFGAFRFRDVRAQPSQLSDGDFGFAFGFVDIGHFALEHGAHHAQDVFRRIGVADVALAHFIRELASSLCGN